MDDARIIEGAELYVSPTNSKLRPIAVGFVTYSEWDEEFTPSDTQSRVLNLDQARELQSVLTEAIATVEMAGADANGPGAFAHAL